MDRNSRLFACGYAILAVILRLEFNRVEMFNASPIFALGIFAGAKEKSAWRFAFSLGAMVITDLALWFITGQSWYSPFDSTRLYVYPCLILTVLLGQWLCQRDWKHSAYASFASSFAFYVISNFFFFLSAYGTGPKDFSGLMTCYVNGLPFFANSLATDLGFTLAMFGLHAWVTAPKVSFEPAK